MKDADRAKGMSENMKLRAISRGRDRERKFDNIDWRQTEPRDPTRLERKEHTYTGPTNRD